MVKLSVRLYTIYDMVAKGSIVADVGSDHGKLMIALFESGKIKKGYAIENKRGPYDRLVKALEEEGIEQHVIPLLSDGVSELPVSVDTVVLAGLGGGTVVDILTSHKEKIKNVSTIIVDAHSALKEVREEISNLGYVIADEKMVKEDDVYYEIIKFIRADVAFYSDKDLEFGPILREEKCSLFKEKYSSRIKQIDAILENKSLPNSRIEELRQEKEKLNNIL